MCVIVAKPKGKKLSENTLKNCYYNNDDGAGYAFVRDGKVEINKGFFTFGSFYEAYLRDTNDQEDVALLHFRIVSAGDLTKENCHPFVAGDMAMAHNGTIRSLGYKKVSDTRDLGERLDNILKHVTSETFFDSGIADLVEVLINRNKVAFLLPDGSFEVLNLEEGYEDDGVWYSNSSYKRQHYRWKDRDFSVVNSSGEVVSKKKDAKTQKRKTNTTTGPYPSGRNLPFGADNAEVKDGFIIFYVNGIVIKKKSWPLLCEGENCFSNLRRKEDIENGYCLHCFTANSRIPDVDNDVPPFVEELLAILSTDEDTVDMAQEYGYGGECPEDHCTGECDGCMEYLAASLAQRNIAS